MKATYCSLSCLSIFGCTFGFWCWLPHESHCQHGQETLTNKTGSSFPISPLLPSPPLPPSSPSMPACPVCYLPTNEAVASQPSPGSFRHLSTHESLLTNLTYISGDGTDLMGQWKSNHDGGNQVKWREESGLPPLGEDEFLPYFSGQQSWGERAESFDMKNQMRVHCG